MTRSVIVMTIAAAVSLGACDGGFSGKGEQGDFDAGFWANATVAREDGDPCWISVRINRAGKTYRARIEGCAP